MVEALISAHPRAASNPMHALGVAYACYHDETAFEAEKVRV